MYLDKPEKKPLLVKYFRFYLIFTVLSLLVS
jgi:hypothetical protein